MGEGAWARVLMRLWTRGHMGVWRAEGDLRYPQVLAKQVTLASQ